MIATDRLTVCAGVPTMLNAIFHEAEGEDVDLSSLRLFASGGASLPEELLTAFEERFGTVVIEGYGLTETCGCATSNRMHRPRKVGTVGTPAPGVSVRLIDSVGEDLLVDEVGEVLIAGPNVMKGYRGLPDATAETIRDGWVHTGDLGSIDADGYLRIVDRIKDLIIRGGYNVYPREVEEVLYRHPDIVEVAVFGVDDERLGEEVAAVAALRAGAPEDVAAIRAWAKERLSSYKVPRLWQFVDTLPKGNTGKILKRAIDRSRFVAQARI
jgi:long-chain acyl-CoA synthetase